jgi:crossover junction endodeoxyribonuclease RuvC
MSKIIGIDPGLAGTGIGVVHGRGMQVDGYAYGSIQTSKAHALPARLEKIFIKLTDVLKNEAPDLMIVEDVFSLQKYPQSGINLGKVTGVILLAGCRLGIPVKEVAVREAKQILSGNGKASKSQLEITVRRLLKHHEPIRPYHASDALALALIGLYRYSGPGCSYQTY